MPKRRWNRAISWFKFHRPENRSAQLLNFPLFEADISKEIGNLGSKARTSRLFRKHHFPQNLADLRFHAPPVEYGAARQAFLHFFVEIANEQLSQSTPPAIS